MVFLNRIGLILFDSFYLGIQQQFKSKADKRKSTDYGKSKAKTTFCRLEVSQY